jgi:eukaryotic-like serine/threonine-protein kinase
MVRDEQTRKSTEDGWTSPADELPPGTLAGEYVIEDFIAQGGCGSVYRARHRLTAGRAAIKVLHTSLVKAPKMVERFVREVEVVRLLHHPCIIDIHELGELPGGRPYYVMEYLEGVTLDNLLHLHGRLSPEDALDILDPVCSALAAAHEAGVVHRDLKASNVFVATEGEQRRIKLLDFGIAKLLDDSTGAQGLTSAGRQVGTLSAMAPEQILCGPIDGRVDIYALGVLLYKLLTGRAPFRSRTFSDLVRQHLEEPPPRPSLRAAMPPGLDEVVLRCLEKRPELRFATVKEFRRALGEVVSAAPDAERKAATDVAVPAIAIQVHLEVRTTPEELDDDLAEDLGRVLDRAEARLRGAGFVVALTAGMTILAVQNIHDVIDAGRARAAALELAWSLYEELSGRPLADDRVDITLGVHADEAVVREASTPEIVGGAIASTWALPAGARGLWAKLAIVEEISGYETQVASGGWVSVLGRLPVANDGPDPRDSGKDRW